MITRNIDQAVEILKRDGMISIPTETVYGLAANAFKDHAVKKIFDLKKRPYFNPLIVHIKSIDFLSNIAIDIPKVAYTLAERFWPGPLTLVLNKHSDIPDRVTAGKKTVAVRVPDHPITQALLAKLEFPLAAPSANPFGSISPTCAEACIPITFTTNWK
ncbi:threonylcarbamoyl-AMP synthase [Filimonas sp.]|nr:threonylcarbamoyl-AMP synthase [Filimonas sp.]